MGFLLLAAHDRGPLARTETGTTLLSRSAIPSALTGQRKKLAEDRRRRETGSLNRPRWREAAPLGGVGLLYRLEILSFYRDASTLTSIGERRRDSQRYTQHDDSILYYFPRNRRGTTRSGVSSFRDSRQSTVIIVVCKRKPLVRVDSLGPSPSILPSNREKP